MENVAGPKLKPLKNALETPEMRMFSLTSLAMLAAAQVRSALKKKEWPLFASGAPNSLAIRTLFVNVKLMDNVAGPKLKPSKNALELLVMKMFFLKSLVTLVVVQMKFALKKKVLLQFVCGALLLLVFKTLSVNVKLAESVDGLKLKLFKPVLIIPLMMILLNVFTKRDNSNKFIMN